jgi:hypothetical protein
MFTLQTLPDCGSDDPFARTAGHVAGFSLHAGVATKAHEREKLRAGTALETTLGYKLERHVPLCGKTGQVHPMPVPDPQRSRVL